MSLLLENVSVQFSGKQVLNKLNLAMEPGEIVAILGNSGSGKSTLLNTIAGFTSYTGIIKFAGQDLSQVPVYQRRFGLVFQDGQLFQHYDVGQNVGYALRIQKRPKPEITSRVAELLSLVGMPGFAARRVNSLSGGEQQRIALARALAAEPKLMLLDEPLSALDEQLRIRLALDLLKIIKQAEIPALFVTHSVAEAATVADRVLQLVDGKLRVADHT